MFVIIHLILRWLLFRNCLKINNMHPILVGMHNRGVHQIISNKLEKALTDDPLKKLPVDLCKLIFDYYFSDFHRMLISSINPFYPEQQGINAYFSIKAIKKQMTKESTEGSFKLIKALTQGLMIFTSHSDWKPGQVKLKFDVKLYVDFLSKCGVGFAVINKRTLLELMIDDRPEEGAQIVFKSDSELYLDPQYFNEIVAKAVMFGKVHLLQNILAECERTNYSVSPRFLACLLREAIKSLILQKRYQNESLEVISNAELTTFSSWRFAHYEEIIRLLLKYKADPHFKLTGGTPFALASKHKMDDLVKLFGKPQDKRKSDEEDSFQIPRKLTPWKSGSGLNVNVYNYTKPRK